MTNENPWNGNRQLLIAGLATMSIVMKNTQTWAQGLAVIRSIILLYCKQIHMPDQVMNTLNQEVSLKI